MATPILKVITEYCNIYVDDINLQALASEDMPLYARRMWGLFQPAIALFNNPPTMQKYLVGTEEEPKLKAPDYGTMTYVTMETYTESTTIELGESFKGYELFNSRIKTFDDFDNVILTPTDKVSYNANDGTITIFASADEPFEIGTILDMDFYTDGYFENDLSGEIMNILGMCFQCVWQDRFNTDWLSMVAKIEDKSFQEQNRANKVRADSERLRDLRRKLAEEMRRFEQNLAYRKIVFPTKHLI